MNMLISVAGMGAGDRERLPAIAFPLRTFFGPLTRASHFCPPGAVRAWVFWPRRAQLVKVYPPAVFRLEKEDRCAAHRTARSASRSSHSKSARCSASTPPPPVFPPKRQLQSGTCMFPLHMRASCVSWIVAVGNSARVWSQGPCGGSKHVRNGAQAHPSKG